MKRSIMTACAMALVIGTAEAAEGWGIDHEKKTRVDAKVVDLLCEVTGDCADNCGDGKRQFGLLLDRHRVCPFQLLQCRIDTIALVDDAGQPDSRGKKLIRCGHRELQLPVHLTLDSGGLDALAHLHVELVPGLRLHRSRW